MTIRFSRGFVSDFKYLSVRTVIWNILMGLTLTLEGTKRSDFSLVTELAFAVNKSTIVQMKSPILIQGFESKND